MTTARRLQLALGVLVLGTTLGGGRVHAHPAAASDVVLTWFPNRSVSIALRTDADTLLVKLEILNRAVDGRARAQDGTVHDRIAGFADVLLSSSHLEADGRAVPLVIESVTPAGTQAPEQVIVRFGSVLPPDTVDVTWRTRLLLGSYPFVVRLAGSHDERYEWLAGPMASRPWTLDAGDGSATMAGTALRALALGFTHILPKGLDHILFVIGLCLLTTRLRVLLIQVSAFTLAHTLTLALTMLGAIALPGHVVEPLIALSIVYIAYENMTARTLRPRRVGLIFAFGLLHGMGFAGVLSGLALPADAFLTSLVGFNAGVELGQLAIIGITVTALAQVRRYGLDARRVVVQPASLAIAVTGAWWVVERL